MPSTIGTIEIRGLGKRKLGELAKQAKEMGMTLERYVKRLVEERLAVLREARTKSFAEIMGPGGAIDEAELDALVEESKSRYHRLTTR